MAEARDLERTLDFLVALQGLFDERLTRYREIRDRVQTLLDAVELRMVLPEAYLPPMCRGAASTNVFFRLNFFRDFL